MELVNEQRPDDVMDSEDEEYEDVPTIDTLSKLIVDAEVHAGLFRDAGVVLGNPSHVARQWYSG